MTIGIFSIEMVKNNVSIVVELIRSLNLLDREGFSLYLTGQEHENFENARDDDDSNVKEGINFVLNYYSIGEERLVTRTKFRL